MKRHAVEIGRRGRARFGFTLIEVVIAVLVLGIAVPPTLSMMDSASTGRVDSINTTRATFLSTIVLETVMADMSSNDARLGFGALADPNTYLNASSGGPAILGLYNRLTLITEPYLRVGLSYTVEVGALVGSDGQVSADVEDNVFRTITVRVRFMSAGGSELIMPVSLMVSEL